MDIYEQAALTWLVNDGKTFASPKFGIAGGWSVPGIVAIQPGLKRCFVVEVTHHAEPRALLEKAKSRDKQWIDALRNQLLADKIVDESWNYFVLLFVRNDQFEWCEERLTAQTDLRLIDLDLAFAYWDPKSIEAREELNTWAEKTLLTRQQKRYDVPEFLKKLPDRIEKDSK